MEMRMRVLLVLTVPLTLIVSVSSCPLDSGSTESLVTDPDPELSCPDDMALVPARPAV